MDQEIGVPRVIVWRCQCHWLQPAGRLHSVQMISRLSGAMRHGMQAADSWPPLCQAGWLVLTSTSRALQLDISHAGVGEGGWLEGWLGCFKHRLCLGGSERPCYSCNALPCISTTFPQSCSLIHPPMRHRQPHTFQQAPPATSPMRDMPRVGTPSPASLEVQPSGHLTLRCSEHLSLHA